MKKNHKGILAFAFFGGIMLTSGVVIGIPGIVPEPNITTTGTPADNYPDEQRDQYCGSSVDNSTMTNSTLAGSTDYIQEYSIPTPCTNPLAITTDYDGNVWFAQTNTGKVAKFDPIDSTFSEYDNLSWPANYRSMVWGADYSSDGYVWFTDEVSDSVWRFSTIDETYERFDYPTAGNSLPQKLLIDGSQIIINDFTGNKLTIMDPNPSGQGVNYFSIPSHFPNHVTAGFALDANDNIWYTNWQFQQSGFLIKFDQNEYLDTVVNANAQSLRVLDFIDIYELPPELLTPNGIAVDQNGVIWLADTTSSYFFSFNPIIQRFTQYVTAEPILETYGNQTGIVKSPISRPYWIESDEQGRVVFNAQTANTISVMNPQLQSLVEYQIPSKNPHWGDCDPGTGVIIDDCGLAQVFGFAIDGEKIWFTEWVENNIGVVDTMTPLPVKIDLGSGFLVAAPGNSTNLNFTITSMAPSDLDASLVLSPTQDFIEIKPTQDSFLESFQIGSEAVLSVNLDVVISEDAIPGTYKILLGAQLSDVAVSKFTTVTIP